MLTLNQFVAAIYGENFNAFSLEAQARILPGFVKGSNLPSLYNSCFQIAACIKSLFQVRFNSLHSSAAANPGGPGSHGPPLFGE